MATNTIRTLLAHAYPGADSALDDRTGGDHLQVTVVSGSQGLLSCSCFGIVCADRAGA